jgi:hypothetical protein
VAAAPRDAGLGREAITDPGELRELVDGNAHGVAQERDFEAQALLHGALVNMLGGGEGAEPEDDGEGGVRINLGGVPVRCMQQ